MSFGYGIGDFLTVAKLAVDIYNALDGRNGAAADYRSLCETLLSLSRAIHAASVVFFNPSNSPHDLDGLCRELECCKKLMNEFLDNYKKYTSSLLGTGSERRLKDTWKKITWSSKTEDVRKLQANLQGHLSALNVYAYALFWQSLHQTQQKAIECVEASQRIEIGMSEMFVLLRKLENNSRLPKTLGYTWEGGWTKDQEPIHFEDALGRVVLLPPILCSKDRFHDVLMIIFKDSPGEQRVTRKEYEVIEGSEEGTVINEEEWDNKFVPGGQIFMSILIWTLSPESPKEIVRGCLRCGESNTRTIAGGGLKCHSCNLVSRNIHTRQTVELLEPSTEPKGDAKQYWELWRERLRNSPAITRFLYLGTVSIQSVFWTSTLRSSGYPSTTLPWFHDLAGRYFIVLLAPSLVLPLLEMSVLFSSVFEIPKKRMHTPDKERKEDYFYRRIHYRQQNYRLPRVTTCKVWKKKVALIFVIVVFLACFVSTHALDFHGNLGGSSVAILLVLISALLCDLRLYDFFRPHYSTPNLIFI